jgi:catechol 2,3-dioxygenase-like lactoylglutathione lyase family enzyme
MPVRLAGLDHVQLAIPAGGEDAARRFYGELLGLTEVPKPPALAARGGCWFTGPGLHLHLGVEDPFRPATKAHPGLLVEDLDAARAALETAGVPTRDDDAGLPVRRFYAEDPFGNRLELIDVQDRGFTDRR